MNNRLIPLCNSILMIQYTIIDCTSLVLSRQSKTSLFRTCVLHWCCSTEKTIDELIPYDAGINFFICIGILDYPKGLTFGLGMLGNNQLSFTGQTCLLAVLWIQ